MSWQWKRQNKLNFSFVYSSCFSFRLTADSVMLLLWSKFWNTSSNQAKNKTCFISLVVVHPCSKSTQSNPFFFLSWQKSSINVTSAEATLTNNESNKNNKSSAIVENLLLLCLISVFWFLLSHQDGGFLPGAPQLLRHSWSLRQIHRSGRAWGAGLHQKPAEWVLLYFYIYFLLPIFKVDTVLFL